MNEQDPAIFLKDLTKWIDIEFGKHGRRIALMRFDNKAAIERVKVLGLFPKDAIFEKVPQKIIRKMYESISKDKDAAEIKNEMWEFINGLYVIVIPKIH
ncbi:hypothetical protein ES703_114747 [subsurface metagenome]